MYGKKIGCRAYMYVLCIVFPVMAFFVNCENIMVPRKQETLLDTGGLSGQDLADLVGGGGSTDPVAPNSPLGEKKLVSAGPAIAPGITYYLDAQNGNDSNNGTSPLTPWKTFKNVNAKTFQPGDHILLEADSIWNGQSVTAENYATLLNSEGAGMLWPKGSGAEGKHIIIDLYDIDGFETATPVVSYVSNKRPIINGNGTPSPGSDRYYPSGTITLYQQHHWKIRNIEVTNTFDDFLADKNHYYKAGVRKGLCGILVLGRDDTRTNPDYRGNVNPADPDTYKIVVENCYVHDVQSMHTNNGASGGFNANRDLGGTFTTAHKIVGGIIVYGARWTIDGTDMGSSAGFFGYNGILLQGNIVKRVALEGLRNKSNPDGSGYSNSNVVFRGNYLEEIAGDGIVLDGVQDQVTTGARGDNKNGLVENNIVKDSCAAPNFITANYAAVWAMTCRNTTFQYNEAYGTLYGYQDGEAWDIDNGSHYVIYQYNYSHHNAGGCILFMDGITNGVFRYNISANDAGTTRYMANVADGPGALPVNAAANSYTAWTGGQTLFHNNQSSVSNKVPLIYNNTFYIGEGITCGLYGNNSSGASNRVGRFYNNILVKAGTGKVYLSYGHSGGGTEGQLTNTATGFKNNLLWAYETNPQTGDMGKFGNGTGTSIADLCGSGGNLWQNPVLKIQESGNVDELRAQRDDAFGQNYHADPESLKSFTSIDRLRRRASIFTPAKTSPVIGAGMTIPAGGGSAVDGAWNASGLEADLFGNPVAQPPIGAAAAPYRPTL
ncbi:MAG: right-handed parallel beta-helix repeat-containing protein [Treponema sp.]|jgi:hypothetical protein|nr:right-handed parallel beta-helix repeat-containing protein [Treponema sp.]